MINLSGGPEQIQHLLPQYSNLALSWAEVKLPALAIRRAVLSFNLARSLSGFLLLHSRCHFRL
jgi:hypothetical protein